MAVFKTRFLSLGAALLSGAVVMPTAFARSVFLNGVDVSSSRSQELRNVQIRINEKGDIFISAPHYQVTEEDFFTPLSRVPANTTAAPVTAGAVAANAPAEAAAPQPLSQPLSQPSAQPAPVKPAPVAVAPAAPAPGSPADKAGAFSNIGLQKAPPESMPPVLPATPPAK